MHGLRIQEFFCKKKQQKKQNKSDELDTSFWRKNSASEYQK